MYKIAFHNRMRIKQAVGLPSVEFPSVTAPPSCLLLFTKNLIYHRMEAFEMFAGPSVRTNISYASCLRFGRIHQHIPNFYAPRPGGSCQRMLHSLSRAQTLVPQKRKLFIILVIDHLKNVPNFFPIVILCFAELINANGRKFCGI